jgi:hypothetical protein
MILFLLPISVILEHRLLIFCKNSTFMQSALMYVDCYISIHLKNKNVFYFLVAISNVDVDVDVDVEIEI